MGARSSKNTTQNNRSDGHLLEYFRNTFVRGGGGNAGPSVVPSGLTATGGVISDYNTPPGAVYRAHIFTSTGTFNVTAPGTFGDTVDYLVVAGGGGGGYGDIPNGRGAGGGGAGGFRTATSFPVNPGSFPAPFSVTVGAGGNGSTAPTPNATSGTPSSFGPITSYGGGYGGNAAGGNGVPGGSGGGGGNQSDGSTFGLGAFGYNPSTPAPVLSAVPLPSPYPITQGYNGANSAPTFPNPGGGGGGSAGNASGASGGGGTANTYAYGPTGSVTYAAGGTGGGVPTAANATFSTGDGGGGGSRSTGPANGGNGGSGIVVVRYQIGQLTATAKATGGAISYYNGQTIHTFISSGTFTNTSGTPLSIDYIAIAGGGGGVVNPGYAGAGGGGAGGVITNIPGLMPGITPVAAIGSGAPNAITITVGSGGASGVSGTPTTFTGGASITAWGGGYGANLSGAASPGGSGGGGAYPFPTSQPGTGNRQTGTSTVVSPPQGNNGGQGTPDSPVGAGGGGGGAGGAGQNASTGGPQYGGYGGIGVQLPTAFRNPASTPGPNGGGLGMPGPGGGSYWVAGGGGGGVATLPGAPAPGGGPGGPYAGGGSGGVASAAGTSGVVNTGGGGGNQAGGGSGIVLIAYPS